MTIVFALQVARILSGEPSQGMNQLEQVAVVAQFLARPEETKISPKVEIRNWNDRTKNTMLDFKAYGSECAFDEISAYPRATKPYPISIRWDCGRYVSINGKAEWEERSASICVVDAAITKIYFGTPTIPISAVRKTIDNRPQDTATDRPDNSN